MLSFLFRKKTIELCNKKSLKYVNSCQVNQLQLYNDKPANENKHGFHRYLRNRQADKKVLTLNEEQQ